MSIYRLDQQLLNLWDWQGPGWALFAVACLLVIAVGKLPRAFVLGMAILLGSLVWYDPLRILAHVLRWWIFLLLATRGAVFVMRRSKAAEAVETVGRVPPTLVALGGLVLVSCLWAADPRFAFLLAGTFLCTLVLAFVVAWRLMDTEDFLPHLCKGVLVVALALQGLGVLFGLAAILTGDPELIHKTGVESRFSGLTMNANGNGVFAALFWPIVLAAPAVYLGRLSKLRWPALVALAICIIFSGSRTAVGVTLMTTTLYGLHRYRVGAVFAVTLVFMCGAGLLLGTPLEELEGTAIDEVVVRSDSLYDFGGRLDRWIEGWEYAMESPAIGHGWGAARTMGAQDTNLALELGRVRYASNLHSAHLSLLVDLGAVGLGLFWLFAFGVMRNGMRILSAPITPESTVSALFFASTMGLLADTFVHGGILSAGSPNALLFWFSTALVTKQAQRITQANAAPDELEPEPAPFLEPGPLARPAGT
jgi:O-antigen ligase